MTVCSRPEDDLRCRQGVKHTLKLKTLALHYWAAHCQPWWHSVNRDGTVSTVMTQCQSWWHCVNHSSTVSNISPTLVTLPQAVSICLTKLRHLPLSSRLSRSSPGRGPHVPLMYDIHIISSVTGGSEPGSAPGPPGPTWDSQSRNRPTSTYYRS